MHFRLTRVRHTLFASALAMLTVAGLSTETASYNDPRHHLLMEGTQTLRFEAARSIGSSDEILLIASLARQETEIERRARYELIEDAKHLRIGAIRAERAPFDALLMDALAREFTEDAEKARTTLISSAQRLRFPSFVETFDRRFPLEHVANRNIDCDNEYFGKRVCDEKKLAKELTCLAQGIYFESRGEPIEGRKAVAKVILNRVASRRYPDTICGVVYQGSNRRVCQFSWACDGRDDIPRHMKAWRTSLTVAADMLANPQAAPFGKSVLSFHSKAVNPRWGLRRVATIGYHLFYAH